MKEESSPFYGGELSNLKAVVRRQQIVTMSLQCFTGLSFMDVKTVSPATPLTYSNSGTHPALGNLQEVKTVPLQTDRVAQESAPATPQPLKSARGTACQLAGDAVRYDPVAISAL